MSVLNDRAVRDWLRLAWEESQSGTLAAHEEGGFILRNDDGSMSLERWPSGSQNEMRVPPHPGGVWEKRRIVATFHTHPNTGPDFQQEPSLTDIRAVRDDTDLHHPEYEGEYVISKARLYCIRKDGTVEEVGDTVGLLEIR